MKLKLRTPVGATLLANITWALHKLMTGVNCNTVTSSIMVNQKISTPLMRAIPRREIITAHDKLSA